MKSRLWITGFLVLLALPIGAQDSQFTLGKFSFSNQTRILFDGGSISEVALGYAYRENTSGSLQFRYTPVSKNEDLSTIIGGVGASLNAVNAHTIEAFLLPFKYQHTPLEQITLQIGGGIYYVFHTENEKGFYHKPQEPVQYYSNDFTSHVVGPVLDAGFAWDAPPWINIGLSGGIVPFFYLAAQQKVSITPGNPDPLYMEKSQGTLGSPYFYANLNLILLRYLSLALLYDVSRLQYKVVGSNEDQTTVTQSLKFEISLNIPLPSFSVQMGYGHTFESVWLDSDPPVEDGKHYIIFAFSGGKKKALKI